MDSLSEYDVIADDYQNVLPNLIISHLNIRSLYNKFEDFKTYVLSHNFDIFLLSETWLSACIHNFMIDIPGYSLFRLDRVTGKGGGVAIYVRNCNNIKHIKVIETDNTFGIENLWITCKINGNKVCIGCIYRPPDTNYRSLQFLEDILAEILISSDNVFCLGDFNLNYLNKSTVEFKYLETLLESFSLTQIIKKPTRVTQESSTLIDYILVNKPNIILRSNVVNMAQFSDHHLIYCLVDMPVVRNNNPKSIIVRDMKNINLEIFEMDARNIDWYRVEEFESIDDKVSFLNAKILQLFNFHAPERKIRITKKLNPWITPNIKHMMKLRDKALSEYRSSLRDIHLTRIQTEGKWAYYKEMRNFVTASIRREKQAYIQNVLNQNHKNSQILWQTLNKLNVHKKYCNDEIPDELKVPDTINQYFINSVSKTSADPANIDFFNNNIYSEVNSTMELHTVTTAEVVNIILRIKTNAKGIDEISSEMLKMCITYCAECADAVTYIINFALKENVMPACWKHALVIPVPKKDKVSVLNDLRPISILPVLSKVIERIVYFQLKKHVDVHNILPSRQSGFRPGFSTTTALLDLTDDMLRAVDDAKVTVTVMLDYSKAFDCLDHKLLLAKLKYYGISVNALGWFETYLRHRQQQVQVTVSGSKISSDILQITRGVPQGSILGPLLFVIYTADIHHIVHSNMHLYADDCQLYESFNFETRQTAINKINVDLNEIHNWSVKNALSLNPLKTTVIMTGTEQQRKKINIENMLLLDNISLAVKDNCKNLGLIFDKNLSFSQHVTKLIQSAYGRLKSVYKYKFVLSTPIKLKLVESLVLSLFDYCDVVYGPCLSIYDQNRIQQVQNSCMRFAANVNRRDHITPYLQHHNWTKMNIRRDIHYCCLIHKIIQTSKPPYLKSKLVFGDDTFDRVRRDNYFMHIPRHSTSSFKGSYSYRASYIYNSLPMSIKGISNFGRFKSKLKEHFMET